MSLDTKIIDLAAGPVDLIAGVADIALELAAAPVETGITIFLQNISARAKVFYAERSGAPARSSLGHCMLVGDGFLLRLRVGLPEGAWIWAARTGTVAVSPALEE